MAKELEKGGILGTPKQFAIFAAIVTAIAFRKWILIGLAGGLLPLFVAQALLLVQLPTMP
jgi:hypothetical protein